MRNKNYYTIKELDKQINWTDEQMQQIKADVKFMQIAYTIRKVRLDKKLTQQQLATKAGIPRTVVSRIESGKHNITLGTLMNIADSMGEEVEIRFVKK